MNLLGGEDLLCLSGALDVEQIAVGEASWLTSPSVNGDSHINNVLDIAEQVIEIFVGHVEGHVANEKGLGWVVDAGGTIEGSSSPVAVVESLSGAVRLNGETTTLVWLLVQAVHGLCSVFRVLEFNIAESANMHQQSTIQTEHHECQSYPLLSPR